MVPMLHPPHAAPSPPSPPTPPRPTRQVAQIDARLQSLELRCGSCAQRVEGARGSTEALKVQSARAAEGFGRARRWYPLGAPRILEAMLVGIESDVHGITGGRGF